MKRAICLLGVLAASASLLAASPGPGPLEIGAGERLLVIAPHPDDETLGAGGLVQRVLARGGSAQVALVTVGDGYVEAVARATGRARPPAADFIAYGERRMREARAAVRELGGDRVRLQTLGFPDAGLTPLLHAHWRRGHPERSTTTGATDPPYPEALDPSVAYDGDDLRRQLERILREAEPTLVAVPDPADLHPDHSATGLFALLALEAYERQPAAQSAAAMPRVLLYLVHWRKWPEGFTSATPPGSDTPLELPQELPEPGLARVALSLSDAERNAKAAALARHASQQEIMASFLRAFVRRSEPFRVLGPTDLAKITASVERSIESQQGSPKPGEAPRKG
jgi:LmbE family N-acetylglucosaminyl deacetylase